MDNGHLSTLRQYLISSISETVDDDPLDAYRLRLVSSTCEVVDDPPKMHLSELIYSTRETLDNDLSGARARPDLICSIVDSSPWTVRGPLNCDWLVKNDVLNMPELLVCR